MKGFVEKTLSPEIFWTALASIGTLLAVLVALFLPVMTQFLRNNRLERLIRAEIDGNFQIIRNMTSREPRSLPNGVEISALQNNDALVSHIDLRMWYQYRYELAASRPDSYERFQKLNRLAESVVDAPKEPAMRLAVQTDEASDFVAKYEETFK